MTSTNLLLDYVNRSSRYQLPERLEIALETDYVRNSELYTDDTFLAIPVLYKLYPNIRAEELLDAVRAWGSPAIAADSVRTERIAQYNKHISDDF